MKIYLELKKTRQNQLQIKNNQFAQSANLKQSRLSIVYVSGTDFKSNLLDNSGSKLVLFFMVMLHFTLGIKQHDN